MSDTEVTVREHGIEKFGRLIDQTMVQARYLDGLIRAEPAPEPVAATTLNIVCLRVAIANHRTRRADLDLLVREIVRLGAEVDHAAC